MTVTNQNSYHAKSRRNHLTGLQIYDAGKIWVENSIFTGIQSVGLRTYFAVKIGTERINISSVGSQKLVSLIFTFFRRDKVTSKFTVIGVLNFQ